jgi:hypothetical protein
MIGYCLPILNQDGAGRFLFYGMRILGMRLQRKYIFKLLPRVLKLVIYRIAVWTVIKLTVMMRKLYTTRYTDANPYKIIYVNPADIENATFDYFSKCRGFVVRGDWDINGKLYMERDIPKSIEQRFVEGVNWSETVMAPKYDDLTLEKRAELIEKLFLRIRSEGYMSQIELLEQNPEAAWNRLNNTIHPLSNEIAVDIGRNGEFLWNICGQHRLAIAKILKVKRIPVQVFARHEQWQNIRNEANRNQSVPEQFREHPDLQDIVFE